MNAKFFVPFETAKQLREKGYNEKISYAYNKGRRIVRAGVIDCNNTDWDNLRKVQSSYPPRLDYIAAPTYHEVVDWLEGKGYVIEALNLCRIAIGRIEWRGRVTDVENDYEYGDWALTREAALNAAILKALEMI